MTVTRTAEVGHPSELCSQFPGSGLCQRPRWVGAPGAFSDPSRGEKRVALAAFVRAPETESSPSGRFARHAGRRRPVGTWLSLV